MKVLLVVNTLPPDDLSGVGEQVMQLAWALEQEGHEVQLLGRGPGGARGPKLLFPLTVIRPALRLIARQRPEVVQLHESDGGLLAVVLWLRSKLGARRDPLLVALQQVSYREERRAVREVVDRDRPGPPVLATPSRFERRFRRWRTPVQIALGQWTARCAELVLVPSRRTGQELVADYGIESFEVLPNVTGAPIAGRARALERSPSADPSPIGRSKSGLGPYLLFVGRLRLRKGVEVLLHAMAQLENHGGAPLLLLAGDGERLDSLRDLSDELGLTDRVDFLGRRDAAEIRELLADATALVVPSIYEGMPLVILEAMDSGTPVVASAVSGIPEVVLDGETGWLVPSERTTALAEALVAVATSPEEARKRGRAGRRRLDQHYRPEAAARVWEAAIETARQRSASP